MDPVPPLGRGFNKPFGPFMLTRSVQFESPDSSAADLLNDIEPMFLILPDHSSKSSVG